MARRGSLVGDAYVRIHADSSAIDRELRREMRAAGKGAGDELVESIDDRIKARAKQKLQGANEAIIEGIVGGKPEWDRQLRRSGLSVEEFATKVEKRMKRMSQATKGEGFKGLQEALDDLGDWAEGAKVEQQIERVSTAIKKQEAAFRSYSSNIRHTEQQTRRLEKAVLDQDRAWQTYADNVDEVRVAAAKVTKATKEQDAAFRSYADNIRAGVRSQKQWERSMERWHKIVLDQDRAFNSYRDNIGRKLPGAFSRLKARLDRDHAMEAYARRVDTAIPRALLRLNRHLDTSEHHFSRFALIMGKVFGKGSRNNFFNFIGTVVGGLARVGVAAFHAGLRILSFAGTFTHIIFSGLLNTLKGIGGLFSGKGFGGIGDALKGIGQGLGELGIQIGIALVGALSNVIPLLIAMGAALAVIQFALFPLIALVANLAGAIFVLGAEIAVALAGGLLALAPALLAFGAALGFAVIAIAKLAKQSKAIKRDLKPLTDAWKGFMKTFEAGPLREVIKALGGLAPLIRTVLTPLMKGFGGAIASVINSFSRLLQSRRFAPTLKALTESLPKIFENFAGGLVQLGIGILQFLEPILPFAERLSENFLKLTDQFLEWTGSAAGKNSIKDFMDNAWQAANDLWDIIILVGEAIGGLIGIATGDPDKDKKTVLDSIKTSLQNLVDFINSPEGKQAIQDFFTNALTTASQLGDSIKGIASALATVDWKSASASANEFVDVIGKISALFIILGSDVPIQTKLMEGFIIAMKDTWVAVYNNFLIPIFNGLIGLIITLLQGFKNLFTILGTIIPGNDPFEQVAAEIDIAIGKLATLSAGIQAIPDGDVTIHVNADFTDSAKGVLARVGSSRSFVSGGQGGHLLAAGAILTNPTQIRPGVTAGEAGREAVVPLDRPLALVDPAVRALAAFAQGRTSMGSGGIVGNGGGWAIAPGAIQVITPFADSLNVAESLLDRMAASVR